MINRWAMSPRCGWVPSNGFGEAKTHGIRCRARVLAVPPSRACQIAPTGKAATPCDPVRAVNLRKVIGDVRAAEIRRVVVRHVLLDVAGHVGETEGGLATDECSDRRGVEETRLCRVREFGVEGFAPRELTRLRSPGSPLPLGFARQTIASPGTASEPRGVGIGRGCAHGVNGMVGALAWELPKRPAAR